MAQRPRVSVGCDVGGTNVKLVRLRDAELEARLVIPTGGSGRASGFVSALADAIASLLPRGRPGSPAGDRAVGVALPGFLDAKRGRVVYLSNVPALAGVPLRRRLAARLGCPVALDADTNAGAVGEAVLGAARGRERVLYLTMGTGLGAALAVRGEPVRVSHHTVGQVAHVPLEVSGPRCRCGERGCAEALLSAKGILRLAAARGLEAASTLELRDLALGTTRGSRSLCRAARSAWEETGRRLGRLCVALGALFSPDAIVIGGGISGAAPLFLPEAARIVEERLRPRIGRPVAVVPAALGAFAGAAGAAILARRAVNR